MCLIFYSEKGELPNKKSLRVAHENNPDGVGIMFHDMKRVRVIRGLLDFDATWNILSLLRGKSYACHFRYRTKGPISSKTCHPFRIRDKFGYNTWMMHNGTFMNITVPQGQSDTQAMAHHLEDIVRDHGSHILTDKSVQNNMAKQIGSYNKVLFMNDDGKVSIVNAKQGIVKGGIWYSNSYSFEIDYRKKPDVKSLVGFTNRKFASASAKGKSLYEKALNDDFEDSDFEAAMAANDSDSFEEDAILEEKNEGFSSWRDEALKNGYVHRRMKD